MRLGMKGDSMFAFLFCHRSMCKQDMRVQKQASHRLATTDLNVICGWVGATRWVARSMTYVELPRHRGHREIAYQF